MKRLLILLLLACATTQPIMAQKWMPKFVRKMLFDKDSSKRSSFFILPVLSSAPETGLEVGASFLHSFYTDTLTPGTRVSSIFAYATVTTKGQTRFSITNHFWTPGNKWHYTTAASYINFPFDFYGIGPNTSKDTKDDIGQKRFKLNLQADKRLGKYFYVGLMVGGYSYKFSNEDGGTFNSNPLLQGRNGGSGVLAGPALIFDNRDNNTYSTRGTLFTSYINLMQGIGGANGYRGGFLNLELAQFHKLSKRLVLGLNIQDQALVGGQSPFYLLPTMGNDELMRGYYNGRYRDRNMLAGQAELRLRLTDRIGLAGFAGAGTVSNQLFSVKGLKPNYGGGLRYFFDVEKGMTMRVDYGIGEKVPGEKRQNGFYLSLGEAF